MHGLHVPVTWLCLEHGHCVIGAFARGLEANVPVIREDHKIVPNARELHVPCW